MDKLSNFFRDEVGHPRYGSFDDILNRDDEFWEKTHDFIQWVFPLNEASRFNQQAPILNQSSVKELASSEKTKEKLLSATDRYKSFLRGNNDWRSGYDHNHMRISRVIKCLRLLSDDRSANEFKHWVAGELGDDIDQIHSESKRHWRLS